MSENVESQEEKQNNQEVLTLKIREEEIAILRHVHPSFSRLWTKATPDKRVYVHFLGTDQDDILLVYQTISGNKFVVSMLTEKIYFVSKKGTRYEVWVNGLRDFLAHSTLSFSYLTIVPELRFFGDKDEFYRYVYSLCIPLTESE
ncbi:MAG: hypothetical protein QXG05_08070 [Nitrososphaerota archaeon]